MKSRNFALIGAAGYIAPRHMRAIKDTGNNLVVALDPNDSVGVIDSYFPQASFFTEFERFDRFLDKLRTTKSNEKVDYVSICSPNYLHDSHARFGLRSDANVICEKPLVINPWNIDGLIEAEKEYNGRIYTILQLRLHPSIIKLKEEIEKKQNDSKYDVDLTYITSRGLWYQYSWKGDELRSGGLATNIGIHFFDMLSYLFGECTENILHYKDEKRNSGYLEFDKARVRWYLSIDEADIPKRTKNENSATFRSIQIDNEEIEFSDGFTDLHTLSYQMILSGEGFGIDENRSAINIVFDMKNSQPIGLRGSYHPFLKKI